MKNPNKLLLLFLFFLLCMSCSKKESCKAVFFTQNKSIDVNSGDFYVTDKGSLYYYIGDKTLRDEIYNQEKIDSIKFEVYNNEYLAMPVSLTFSKVIHNSDFVFTINNKTGKIVLDTYNEKQMFTLASEKTNIENLIKSGVIKPILIKE